MTGVLSRRAFLGTAASAALCARRVRADGVKARAVFVLIPNGLPEDRPWTQSWVAPGASETTFVLGTVARPLEPFRRQCVFFDGLNMVADVRGDQHPAGQAMLLTGSGLRQESPAVPMRASIDQRLAQVLGRAVTPAWPSLALAVQPDRSSVGSFSFLADGTRVAPQADPRRAARELFGGNAAGSSRVSRRARVLESVRADVRGFRDRLPSPDRVRLEGQLAALDALASRLDDVPTCAGVEGPAETVDLGSPQGFALASRAQIDVIVAALACDLTRVATLLYRGCLGGLPCSFPPINRDLNLHQLSHMDYEAFTRAKTMHFDELAYLVERLAAVPDGDGTLLDHTIVFAGTEIANGHVHERMPFVTIGGAALGVRTGRCLSLPPGTPHDALLASVADVLGAPAAVDAATPRLPGFVG